MNLLISIALLIPSLARQPADESVTSRPAQGSRSTERREARERAFKEALTGTILQGTWQMTGPEGLAGKAPLSEARPEKYTIDKVSKASGDHWVISARIEYADKDATIPVTVRVVWAGDTPVITVDDMAFPGLGTYSARVLIHRGFYSGTWFGKNYGGVLSGQVVKLKNEAKAATTRPAGDDSETKEDDNKD